MTYDQMKLLTAAQLEAYVRRSLVKHKNVSLDYVYMMNAFGSKVTTINHFLTRSLHVDSWFNEPVNELRIVDNRSGFRDRSRVVVGKLATLFGCRCHVSRPSTVYDFLLTPVSEELLWLHGSLTLVALIEMEQFKLTKDLTPADFS